MAHSDKQLRPYGSVHYSAHSYIPLGTLDQNKVQALAFHVHLHNIPQLLPNDHEWNINNSFTRRIFSYYRESPIIHNAITLHEERYQRTSTTQYGLLENWSDFYKLINHGQRNEKRVIFTYVLTHTGWYFSAADAASSMDKHLVHSGAALSVKYAGEFHIGKNLSGNYKLVIDNNSGSYAPPTADLPKLKKLLEGNFPGISIEAKSRHDEELKKVRREIHNAWV